MILEDNNAKYNLNNNHTTISTYYSKFTNNKNQRSIFFLEINFYKLYHYSCNFKFQLIISL